MIAITPKKIAKFALLPEIKTRLSDLFFSGLNFVPYFMALVYQVVRLLPDNHPYLNPENIGRFGVRHVIAEAANNLVLSRKNLDQIILFVFILFGLIILIVQVALLVIWIFGGAAMAAMPTSFSGFFVTPESTAPHDLAYIFLDMVFGVEGMFGSCVDGNVPEKCLDIDGVPVVDSNGRWILQELGWPFPIHKALHQMFAIYSIGLLVVAAMVTLYFIVTVVAETAQTGTAFGKRFNKVWAPIRIVVAFGLLIPLNSGLNSAQYIVLYAAKYGSGFATNGWHIFSDKIGDANFSSNGQRLISESNVPEVGGLLQFLYSVRTCYELEVLYRYNGDYDVANANNFHGWLVGDPMLPEPNPRNIKGADGNAIPYKEMIEFANGDSQVIIRFGPHDPDQAPKEKGYVEPVCGELIFPLVDPRIPGSDNPPEPGPEALQRYYWFAVWEIIDDVFSGRSPSPALTPYVNSAYPKNTAHRKTQWDHRPNELLPPPEFKTALQEFYTMDLEAVLNNPAAAGLQNIVGSKGALQQQEEDGRWDSGNTLKEKGWAGAGIWYNKIAQMNGSMAAATRSIPMPRRYPKVMELVMEKKKQYNQNMSINERFRPKLADGQSVNLDNPEYMDFAGALWVAFDYWQADGHTSSPHTAESGNPVIDLINHMLGTEGLFSMRKNDGVHPLAKLVGVGRSLIESSIRNFGWATGATVAGAIGIVSRDIGSSSISFMMTITQIGITAGFILFYVVPFMPFMYFFFGVSGWIKGIFEAMVGAPLWACAHIRIDGDGLPGKAAVNGYFLIFEIFLRPILIVFGLLASISIFSAMVSVLNQIWDVVTANLTGFDVRSDSSLIDKMRNPVDEFFFTIVYTAVCYMMAMSCFKMIDLVPNNILRWMNQSLKSFNDGAEDPAQNLTSRTFSGISQTMGSVGGGLQGLMQGIGGK